MIYTVTLNPSIDYIVRLDSLVPGITNRTTAEEYYYEVRESMFHAYLQSLTLKVRHSDLLQALRVTPLKKVFATTGLSPTLLSLKVEFQELT